ncbi:MAG: Uma2 family endonuclease [Armatimonadetes bacterium]|nr:Uma2 family endonuclease [Anaerolineae bacterium]
MLEITKTRISIDEYFAMPETMQPTLLLDGELITLPGPDPLHQDIVLNIYDILRPITRVLGGKLVIAPADVRLGETTIAQPDIFWMSPGGLCVLEPGRRYVGAPDLVAEALSPGTERYDKAVKFTLYEQHGVREYWIIDPRRQQVEVWQLTEGIFALHGTFGATETFASAVLGGQGISLSAIFAER